MRQWIYTALITLAGISCLNAQSAVVSLKSKQANLRAGPGKYYPARWVLLYPTTPLRVIEKFDVWRKVEDPWGGTGWIHKSLVWNKKFVYVAKDILLRQRPQNMSTACAFVKKGAILTVKKTCGQWFYIHHDGFYGYVPAHACWRAELY